MPESESDTFQSLTCAERLKALGDPTRLRIIDVLRSGELTVGDIAEFIETELVMVSHHLQILKHAGFVRVRREGRYMVYALHEDVFKKGTARVKQYLDLGCCRIEVPARAP